MTEPEQIAPPDKVETALPQPANVLNVAVVYQDAPTRKWAAQVCDLVSRLIGKEAMHSTWWAISHLNDPEMLADSVRTAMEADVIVVSIYDAKELPANLRSWIEAWLPRRRLPTGSLMALIGLAEQPGAQDYRVQDHLRAIARKGHLDFLLRERVLPAASHGFLYVETTGEQANTTTPVLQEALNQDHNCCAIGNE